MDRPTRIWTLILLMASVALGVGGITLATLYRTGFRQQEARLVNIARSQARLLEAVARFDLEQSPGYPGGAMEATLVQFRDATRRFAGMGETGEFTLARRVGDSLVFLMRQRAGEPEAPLTLPLSGHLAEPQLRALKGESGTITGPDYRGVQVLAAFEPLGIWDLGIVAKMDLAEIRAPFIRAGLLAGAAGALLILLGSGLFLRVSEPLLARLRESETRHRTLAREMEAVFRASPLAMFVLDGQGRVVRWNSEAEGTFGWREDEVLDRELPIIPPDKREEFQNLRERIMGGEGFTGMELRRMRKDGSLLDVRLSTAPLTDADGQATGIMAVMEDITQEKAASEALRESEKRLDLALKGAGMGFWDVRLPEGSWVYSRFLAELLGHGPGQMEPTLEQWESLLHPEDRERAREGLDGHIRGETEFYSEEYRMRTGHGDHRWIRSRGRVMERGSEGGSVRVLGTHLDITEERKAQATEAQFQAVLEQMPLGFLLAEAPTGRILHHNRQTEAILRHPVRPTASMEEYGGFGAQHADGTPFRPEEYPAAQVLGSGEPILNQILRYRAGDGAELLLDFSAVPVHDDSGVMAAVVVLFEDVTERKRMEEALRASEERYRSLFQNSHAPMLIIHPHSGLILDANPRAQAFYGYTRQELLERTVFDLNALPETDAREALNDAGAGRRGHSRLPHRMADGTLRTVEIYSGPVQLPEGPRILFILHDITDQVKTESELSRQRELFQAVFHHAPVMMAVTDPEGEWILANRTFLETLGWSLKEIREHPDLLAKLYPEEAERERVLAAIASGTGRWSDYQTRTRDGTVLDTTWADVRLADGSSMGIGQDITERKQTQRELERTNQLLTRLLAVAGELAMAESTDEVSGIIRLAARALSETGGVTIVGHAPTQAERALLAALGEMAGTAWDALEARESLLASETKYRLLADNTLDVIWTMNMEMEFTYVNPAIRILTGHSPEEWVGTRLRDHSDEKHYMEMRYLVQEFIAGGPSEEGAVFETEILRKDGTPIPVEIHGKIFFDEDGTPVQIQGVTRDVTEQKRMEHELREWAAELESRVEDRTEELEAANRELEAFSYTVSHDLKAPLRAIDGFSGIMEEDFGPLLDEEGRRVLAVVRSNTQQMAQLIDDLLAFSRLGRAEMKTGRVELGPLVQACMEDLPQEMEGRQLELVVEDLPTVLGDRLLLRQAMMNLLDNALKFTSNQKVAKIRVGSYRDGDEIVVFVRDNGVGFDEKYAHKLFGVFQRLHHADEFSGTGVGLANVRRIVERHGGRVWAQGEPGEGATLYMALPSKGDVK